MWETLGHIVKHPEGYSAFIPLKFPPGPFPSLPSKLELSHGKAMHLIGKLDGISKLLPDKNFLLMFMRKEATSSSQNSRMDKHKNKNRRSKGD